MKGRLLCLSPRGAALSVDGRLQELAVAASGSTAGPDVGAIHQARASRELSGGMFLDLGAGETGFLPAAEGLRPGDWALVEVVRRAEGRKAARVTRKATLRARLAALTIGAPGVNLSRRIKGPELRARLMAATPTPPETAGLVIRSAAAEAGPDALAQTAQRLMSAWARLEETAGQNRSPRLLHPAPSPLQIGLWDWGPWDQFQVGADLADIARAALAAEAPEWVDRMLPVEGDPFDLNGLTEQIQALLRPRVSLPANGWMAMERTAALITVDVNASAAAAHAINHAAATEIPRQLRLRGWGGMIVVDFAGDSTAVEKDRLEQALRAAKAGLKIAGWGPLGLLEATRRFEGAPLTALWQTEEGGAKPAPHTGAIR